MEKLRKGSYVLLSVFAVTLALVSILSIFRNTDNRFLKMLDFPRIQFFLASLVSMLLLVFINKKWRWHDYLISLGLVVGLFLNGRYLINYTSLVSTTVPSIETPQLPNQEIIKLLMANVKMSNKESAPLLELIQQQDPDILLAMETDAWWSDQLKEIKKQYSYSKEVINDKTYGMMLYSKFPLENIEVHYLQNENTPSIFSTVQLINGKKFKLFAMHPVPPTHFKDLPDNEGKKEAEMVKLGNKLQDQTLPLLVAGDINDVAWSHTDELTETKDLLHDVRVGRGFYTSFDAQKWYMRWPLDHVFVSKDFKLHKLERMPNIQSDHFPIYVELVL